jgi:hypothetical protein
MVSTNINDALETSRQLIFILKGMLPKLPAAWNVLKNAREQHILGKIIAAANKKIGNIPAYKHLQL